MGTIVNRQGLADSMGVSPPTIDKWLRAQMPFVQRGGKGKDWQFDLADCIDWYAKREVEKAVGGETTDLDEIEKRTATAKMEIAELDAAQRRGEVAPIADFERAMAQIMAQVQQNVMNVPQRACNLLLGCTDETEFKKVMRAELTQALEVASSAALDLSDPADDEDADDAE